MRSQPPDRNNPANPLIKVAALQIDKETTAARAYQAKIRINLTFKQSKSLQGKTEGVNKQPITVTFAMAIAKANLRLEFIPDPADPPNKIRISKVAFVEAINSGSKLTSVRESQHDTSIGVSADVGATAALSSNAGLMAKARGQFSTRKTQKSKNREKTVLSRSTIRATYAGHEVHWEIAPCDQGPAASSILIGEIFKRQTGSNQIVDACLVARTDKKSLSTMTARASLLVNMSDMIIEDISFTDELGSKVGLSEIDRSVTVFEQMSLRDEAKKRILKQIIRRHLVSQGMTVDGPLVEISRAES